MLSEDYLKEVAFALSKFHQLRPSLKQISKQSIIKRVFLDQKETILSAIQSKMGKNIYNE